ncbi:hypothetical protein [Amycolatopsis viridis]|uniref:Secreted protein n=1 Tax=Amycolatopsis viridis TaxID=185678 RepID=A0ABX0SNZ2_9PSEU|nr:hypothetical protein [Amycolatopsis viridis]NIH77647.1 hypothetical protein [Amycolatopsis viridis]
MHARRSILLSLAVASGAALAVLAPGTASASDSNTAVASSGPSRSHWVYCLSDTGVEACYERDRDLWFVRDTSANGHAAYAEWDNYYNGKPIRYGTCTNRLGAGHWGVCDKSYRAGSTIKFGATGIDSDARVWSPELYA